jgi:flagellar motility protein MotE (MotC chaperone)
MTKQQPCASKLRLSKLCRWLIALGIAKLALFGAWSVDLPLPQILFSGKNTSSLSVPVITVNSPADEQAQADKKPPADAAATSSPSLLKTGEVRLASLFSERKESAIPERKEPIETKESAARPLPESSPAISRTTPTQAVPAPVEDILQAVAARSAAPLPSIPVAPLPPKGKTPIAAPAPATAPAPAMEATPSADAGERSLASGVDADKDVAPAAQETAESNSWWSEIMTLTRLPVPVLGVQQIAHAAALDMPPPTVRPASPGASPFAPPEQGQVRTGAPASGGQDGAPLPLRSRSNTPQAGAGAPAPASGAGGAAPAPAVKGNLSADSPDRKQQELARREQDVLMLKQQMESRLQELHSAEKKVQGMLKEAHGVHDQKIKHLISSYTNMKPKQAALALESLDERLAVRILAGMNPKQAGEVLTYTNPKTVAKLTELLARMQLPGE